MLLKQYSANESLLYQLTSFWSRCLHIILLYWVKESYDLHLLGEDGVTRLYIAYFIISIPEYLL